MVKDKRKTHEEFVEKLKSKNANYATIKLLERYSGALAPIKCKCKKCGHEWSPIASSLMQGTGCPVCAKNRIAKTNSKFLKEYRISNPPANKISNAKFLDKFKRQSPYVDTISILSGYSSMRERIKCRCEKCGQKWSPLPFQLLNGQGCPNCSHSSTSFMEQFIVRALMYVLSEDEVVQRDRKTIGKELDIFLPNHAIAIEIGSWKWHRKTFKQDVQKIDLCKKRGIRLFTVFDNCKEEIVTKNKDIYFFPEDLRQEKNNKTLIGFCEYLFEILGKNNIRLNDNDWKKISHSAYLYSQRRTNAEFIEAFLRKNPHANEIKIMSEYKDARTPIKCRCANCGMVWRTAANELIRGSGCPKCEIKKVGIARRKKDAVQEWKSNHPNGNKKQCSRDTGISYVTVLKWWE